MHVSRKSVALAIGITCAVVLGVVVSYAQGTYRLTYSSLSGGSGQHLSSNFRLRGHVQGRIEACRSQSTNFIIQPYAATACNDTAQTTQTPSATFTPTATGTSINATITPTATPTPTRPISPDVGDTFEADDRCQDAQPMNPDGSIQHHNFHQQADTDWVYFVAQAGVTYLVEGRVPSDSEVDLGVELYNSCTGGAQQTQNHTFSPDIRIKFTAAAGTIYLRLLNDNDEEYGDEQTYQLSVRSLAETSAPGALIIVAGRIKNNDPLQANIHTLANRAWQLWHSHGYPAERIRYLATDLALDADEDGESDVYALPNRANLRAAITEWATELVSAERPLTIYLVDHGNPNLLYLDKRRSELLHPQELDEWLDSLEAAAPGVQITVIIEACYSGSFIAAEATSISSANRVIITSTDATTPAWASKQGAFFSDSFFDSLAQGHTLYTAYQEGQAFARRFNSVQQAWLDDNGDSLANQEDGRLATQRSFIIAGTLDTEKWAPYIPKAELRNIGNERYEIWVRALDDEGIQAVWAEVYPPSYQPPSSSEELVAGPVPISLQARGDDWYAALYGQFDEIGEYRIILYAEDESGLRSHSHEAKFVTGQRVYLPLVTK
ncbi:MAG: C13 family peptidase [Caldilineaceae bacterium]